MLNLKKINTLTFYLVKEMEKKYSKKLKIRHFGGLHDEGILPKE